MTINDFIPSKSDTFEFNYFNSSRFNVLFFSTSSTPLITVILGTLILICYVLYDDSPKLFAHIAILLMFLVFFGLFNPMMRAIGYSDPYAIARVLVMQLTTVYSIACFIVSFINARKKS